MEIRKQEVATVASGSSRGRLWTARAMGAVVVLFMLFDGIGKLAKPKQVIEGTLALGFEEHHVVVLGILGIVCTIVYAVPRTRFLGALLLTAYLGGAVAVQLRVDNPLLSNTFFSIYLAIIAWGPLWLMEPKVRELIWKRN